MAEEMGFNYQREIKNFALAPDPVDEVLTAWSTKKGSTVGKLMDILEDIERDDVLSELPKTSWWVFCQSPVEWKNA